eukprot:1093-Heterococcus_DN1.PRE.1
MAQKVRCCCCRCCYAITLTAAVATTTAAAELRNVLPQRASVPASRIARRTTVKLHLLTLTSRTLLTRLLCLVLLSQCCHYVR